jgi:NTE family protein
VSRIGLVLGGGGAVGHGFHSGVLAALEDVAGFDARTAEVIVGTSGGATIAGLVRAGVTGADLASTATHGSPSPRWERLELRRGARSTTPPPHTPRPPRSLAPASLRGVVTAARTHHASSPAVIASALLPVGPVATVSDGGPLTNLFPGGWPTAPLWITAVDLDEGRRVIFGRDGGPTADVPTAVAASCALPGWFAPVVVDDARYVDGAVWSATNADALDGEQLDLVIISAPLSGRSSPLHWWHRRHLHREVHQLRTNGTDVMTIEPTAHDVAVMGPNIMDRSRRAAVTRHTVAAMRHRLARGDLAAHRELLVRRT